MNQNERSSLLANQQFQQQVKHALGKKAGKIIKGTASDAIKAKAWNVTKNIDSYLAHALNIMVFNESFDRVQGTGTPAAAAPIGWNTTDAQMEAEMDVIYPSLLIALGI